MLLFAAHCLRLLTEQTVLAGQLAVALIFSSSSSNRSKILPNSRRKKYPPLSLARWGSRKEGFHFIYICLVPYKTMCSKSEGMLYKALTSWLQIGFLGVVSQQTLLTPLAGHTQLLLALETALPWPVGLRGRKARLKDYGLGRLPKIGPKPSLNSA